MENKTKSNRQLAEEFYYLVNFVTNYYGSYVKDSDELRSYLNLEYAKLIGKFDEDRGEAEMFFKASLFSKARRYIVEVVKPYRERYKPIDDVEEVPDDAGMSSPILEDILQVSNQEEKEVVKALLRYSDDSFTTAVNKAGFHHMQARRHIDRLAKKLKVYRE